MERTQCANEECDNLTAKDDPDAFFVYDDPFSETGVVFCSDDCWELYSDSWYGCETCEKLLCIETGFYVENFVKVQADENEEETFACRKCFAIMLLQNGQKILDFSEQDFSEEVVAYSLEDFFPHKTPQDFGYVQVPGFVDVEWDGDRFVVPALIGAAMTQIAYKHKVILVEHRKEENVCVTLWCYGLYHDITRNAIVTWMLCSRTLLISKGYCCPKDISRMIGKMVHATRNDQQVWMPVAKKKQSKRIKR